METKQKNNRKTALLLLPLIFLPFLALGFYALGGGKNDKNNSSGPAAGINMELPQASFKGADPASKMGFYAQTDKDSSRQKDLHADRLNVSSPALERTNEITAKLEALDKQISTPSIAPNYSSAISKTPSNSMKADIDRLESLMKMTKSAGPVDPEMAQLSAMMDKIIAIQNPNLLQQNVKAAVPISDSTFKAIPARIEGTQKIKQGGIVKLRLMDSISCNGVIVPKGHMVFAFAQITNQRMLLNIRNIRLGTSIIPVDLSVFAMDGLPGIDAPEAELTEAGADGASNAIGSVQLLSMEQSIGVQAAGAGIQAAKGLFSKKLKRLRVKLRDGQPILLRKNK